jgi:protein-disulfide isomerase
MAQGQKGFGLMVAGVAVVGVLVIVYLMLGRGAPSIPANVVVSDADTTGFRGYMLGDPNAPIEITEYADFQCPGCEAFASVQFPDIEARLIETGKARFRYRDLPLDDIHPEARLASHAAACADDQGKFWPTMKGIYQRQGQWSMRSNAYDVLGEAAAAGGVDMATWRECMESAKHAGRIQASYLEAGAVGVGSTPTFLIDGRLYGGMSADQMVRVVDSLISAQAAPAQ